MPRFRAFVGEILDTRKKFLQAIVSTLYIVMASTEVMIETQQNGLQDSQHQNGDVTATLSDLLAEPTSTTNSAITAVADTTMTDAAASKTKPAPLPTTVQKPNPYTFDLGNLLCNDTNPIPISASATSIPEAVLQSTARDCAQVLLNQLLSTCPITKSSDSTSVTLALPPPTTPLPREKSVPVPKAKTTWEKFAEKKGIGKAGSKATGKEGARKGKLVYDDASGEWVPRWGYKGKNKDGEGDWLVEVDDKKERETGEAGDARKEKREERKERVRRQERKQRANERKAGK